MDYCNIEWFALEMNRDHSVFLRLHPSTAFQTVLLTRMISNDRMISVHFQGKPFNITIIQVYALTNNAEEAEQFYEGLQDLLELTPPKDVLFIIGDWNAKVGTQEIYVVTGKFELENRMKQVKG